MLHSVDMAGGGLRSGGTVSVGGRDMEGWAPRASVTGVERLGQEQLGGQPDSPRNEGEGKEANGKSRGIREPRFTSDRGGAFSG